MRAYVGLGSNLGDRESSIRGAVARLAADPAIAVVAISTLRETEPVGYTEQPRFLNGACALETNLRPRDLLERLLSVELEFGRTRDGSHWGPRTLDLDLLLYGDEIVAEPDLVVPHPELTGRRFALEPLVELDPSLALPDGRRLADLLAELH